MRTLAFTLLLSLPAAAAPTVVGTPATLQLPPRASPVVVERAVRDALLDPSWTLTDPAFGDASDVVVRAHRVGDHVVARAVAEVDGVVVEGADRVVVVDDHGVRSVSGVGKSLRPVSQFRLSEGEALVVATGAVRGAIINDATVEAVSGLGQRVWLAKRDGLHAAWRVRVPTFRFEDAADVWIDAQSGRVLGKKTIAERGFTCGNLVCETGEDISCPTDCLLSGGEGEGEGEGEGDAVGEGEGEGEAVGEGEGEGGAGEGEGEGDGGEGEGEGPLPAASTAARVFEFAPAASGIDEDDLVTVELHDLVPAEVGAPLAGFHFQTANCCKQVVCLDGSQDCLTDLPEDVEIGDVARCADQDDVDAGDAFVSEIQAALPVDQLPIPANLAGFIQGGPCPDEPARECLFLRSAFCAELPRAVSSADGWNFTPVDAAGRAGRRPCVGAADNDARPADPAGCAAEEDAFAEVTVYHSTQRYFEHVRAVLGDESFCLGGLSQLCEDDGTASLDGDGQPLLPFHIATNVLFPQFDQQALINQLIAGQGGSPGNPIVIDDFQRIPNAAFIPATTGGPVQIPPELEVFARLFTRPYDSNVYFQGDRDFAYDGDVTRHEFTHALVHSFVPNLGSFGLDDYGSHAESGGLNEGWADYFSSSSVGNPTVGDYAGQGLGGAETGLRNNDNDKKCPDDIIGEVHADSEHWAGALWAIREHVLANVDGATAEGVDRAILSALALADDDEDMTRASARVVTAITASFGGPEGTFAQAEFDGRGVNGCERVHTLSVVDGADLTVTPKAQLLQPGTQELGLENFAPSVLQFRVAVPKGSGGFELTWQEQAGGLLGGGDPAALSVVVLETTGVAGGRIHWAYEGGNAIPEDADGNVIDFDVAANAATIGAANQDTGIADGSFTHTLASDGCNDREFVIAFVAPEGGATLGNISVENIDAEAVCANEGEGEGEGEGEPDGCPCSGTNGRPSSLILLGGVLLLLKRRRR